MVEPDIYFQDFQKLAGKYPFRLHKTNKKSLIIVSAIILVCIGSFALRGLSQSIDFTGGRNFKVHSENPVEPEQVRELIADKFGEDVNVNVIAIGTDKKTVRISTNYRIADEGNNGRL